MPEEKKTDITRERIKVLAVDASFYHTMMDSISDMGLAMSSVQLRRGNVNYKLPVLNGHAIYLKKNTPEDDVFLDHACLDVSAIYNKMLSAVLRGEAR